MVSVIASINSGSRVKSREKATHPVIPHIYFSLSRRRNLIASRI